MARLTPAELFPTESPIDADELIGRESTVADLAAALAGGMHRVIAAPRRTGKTTVCDAALAQLRKQGFYVAEVDLWGISEQGELAAALAARTVENRTWFKKHRHSLSKLGRDVLSSVQIRHTTSLEAELGQSVEVAWRPHLADRDPHRYLEFALRLPEAIAERDDKRIVVFFDEFQSIRMVEQVGRGKDPEAIQKLMRSVFQRTKRVSYLFAGSLEHMMRDIFSPEKPLGYFGGFQPIAEIEEDAWRTGIRERLERDDTTISDGGLALLLELSESHPRATMLIAQQVYQLAIVGESHTIDEAGVRAGAAMAMVLERAKHEQLVERIRATGTRRERRHTLRVAQRVARAEPIYRGAKVDSDIAGAARALRDAGIIDSTGRGKWLIVDPLLRRYLAEMDPLEPLT